MRWLFFIGLGIGLAACSKYEPDFPTAPEPEAVSALKITTRHIYQTSPALMDSLVQDVSIELYRQPEDRDGRINRYDFRTTDSTCTALFGRVPDGTWYLLADGESLGVKTETVVLNGGALELLEIRFP